MATDLERARRKAQDKLDKLTAQFNSGLPAQMQRVRADIERLDEAIAAAETQVDASDLVAKYLTDPAP